MRKHLAQTSRLAEPTRAQEFDWLLYGSRQWLELLDGDRADAARELHPAKSSPGTLHNILKRTEPLWIADQSD
jgi:hypothetical protein